MRIVPLLVSAATGVCAPSIAGFKDATIQPARGGLAVCVSGIVQVQAHTFKNLRLNYEIPNNQSQVTEIFVELFTSGSPFIEQVVGGMQEINRTYGIGATLCTRANSTSPDQVQILTYGIGFDRYYWDFAPRYSYVDVATQYGHATFLYNRLGVGKSSKADSVKEVQAPLEVAIANSLAQMLRQGRLGNITFSKVIGSGHSFGSIITQAITATSPNTLDAAILTGFSVNITAMPAFTLGLNLAIASQNAPYHFSSLNNGYLTSSTAISQQIGFFRAPGFDPDILSLAEATKGTVTFEELLSTTAITAPASNWIKPVAVVNGVNDLPFCFGNCTYTIDLAQAVFPKLYPNANTTGSYVAEVAGHGLNLHHSAVEAYHYIQDIIGKNI